MWESFFRDMQHTGAGGKQETVDSCSGHIVIGLTLYGWSLVAGSVLSAFTSYSLMWVGVHCNRQSRTDECSERRERDINRDESMDRPLPLPAVKSSDDIVLAQEADEEAASAMSVVATAPSAAAITSHWRTSCHNMVICCNCIATDGDLLLRPHQEEVIVNRPPSYAVSSYENNMSVLEIEDTFYNDDNDNYDGDDNSDNSGYFSSPRVGISIRSISDEEMQEDIY